MKYHTHDSNALLKKLPNLPDNIEAIWGDGAYDNAPVYEALYKKKIKPVIPPQRNAVLNGANYRKQRHLSRRSLVQGIFNMALCND